MSTPEELDPVSLSRRIIAGGELSRSEARDLFLLAGEDVYDLFYAAHKVRRHFHGNKVTFCSILPTKFGNCSEDCKFCAQSAPLRHRHRAPRDDGRRRGGPGLPDARDNGASAFGIVNSGRGPTKREWPKIMEAVHAMKEVDGICHCATLGTLDEEQARDLKAAGVRRINHNLETSKEFYPQIVTTHDLAGTGRYGSVGPESGSGDLLRLHLRHGRDDRRSGQPGLQPQGAEPARRAAELPLPHPRHPAGKRAAPAADGDSQDHRGDAADPAASGSEGGRRPGEKPARPAKLDFLRRQRPAASSAITWRHSAGPTTKTCK